VINSIQLKKDGAMLVNKAVLLILGLGVAGASETWGPSHSTRCSEQCQGVIDVSAAVETCYGLSQGKPVKACLSAFRDAIKKSCAKVCDQGTLE